MPLVVELQKLEQAAQLFQRTCQKKQLAFALASSVAVCPKRFNDWLDQWGSKGGILGEALKQLIGHCLVASQDNETLHFFIDKHGGRNNYSAMLQNAIPDGLVVAKAEAMECSAYQFLGLKRDIYITIQPRADAEYFCVALASMVSKYVRELLMVEFNRFWQTHVPGLEATAGYPVDSARFYDEIRPTVERLGFAEATIWRRK